MAVGIIGAASLFTLQFALASGEAIKGALTIPMDASREISQLALGVQHLTSAFSSFTFAGVADLLPRQV